MADNITTFSINAELAVNKNEFKQALASFRQLLTQLRQELHAESNFNSKLVVKRLQLLVPLYRAMHSVYQQLGTGSRTGQRKYIPAFAPLQKRIDKAIFYQYSEPFGPSPGESAVDVRTQVVLAPGSPLSEWSGWRLLTVGDLMAQAKAQANLEIAQEQDFGRLKRDFCHSLDEIQRQQITALMAMARRLGRSSVALTPADIDFSTKI